MKKLISNSWFGLLLVVLGFAGWKWGVSFLGDNAAIVGPDRLVYKAVNIFGLGLSLIFTLAIVRFLFSSVWKFTDPLDFGDHRKSPFETAWKDNPNDPRLWISILTYLLVFLACSQVFSS